MTWWLKTRRNILYSCVRTVCCCIRHLKPCLKFLLIIFGTRTARSLGKCWVCCRDVAASLHCHFWWHIWVKAFLNAFSPGKCWGLGEGGILAGDWERCPVLVEDQEAAGSGKPLSIPFLLLKKVISLKSPGWISLFFYLYPRCLADNFVVVASGQ